ncbi:MAG: DNA translocase FtsK 4TM domain-containing protein, partial [Halanaerobiales bacterium]
MPKKNKDNEKKKNKNANEKKKNESNTENLEKRKNEILGILIVSLALLSSIALFTDTAGYVGQNLSDFYKVLIGYGSFIIPVLLLSWGITLIRLKGLKINTRLIGFLILYISIISLIHTYFFTEPINEAVFSIEGGGIIGGSLSWVSLTLFGRIGSYIMLGAFSLIGFLLWLDVLLISLLRKIKSFFINFMDHFKNILSKKKIKTNVERNKEENNGKKQNDIKIDVIEEDEDIFAASNDINDIEEEIDFDEVYAEDFTLEDEKDQQLNSKKSKSKTASDKTEKTNQDNNLKNNSDKDEYQYRLPDIKLLRNSNKSRQKPGNKSGILEDTLNSFGVKAKVIKVNHGPTITRYEVQPASGVKVSKIVNLADDIALSLAAPGVRIEAPIPGKAAVGVEVPHMKNITVTLRDIIASRQFAKAKGKLDLALGMGIDGKPIIADLGKMPHLLVAGATGSGKSVCINTIITSILYQAKPNQVKLLLIDPKKVELTSYQGLPHLFAPVVTDPKKAASVLKLVVDEMENRYELFSGSGSRGIDSYNKNLSDEDRLPYIVVIIDELSDLMMVAANDVEDNI